MNSLSKKTKDETIPISLGRRKKMLESALKRDEARRKKGHKPPPLELKRDLNLTVEEIG